LETKAPFQGLLFFGLVKICQPSPDFSNHWHSPIRRAPFHVILSMASVFNRLFSVGKRLA
jgi:hypothetical protein